MLSVRNLDLNTQCHDATQDNALLLLRCRVLSPDSPFALGVSFPRMVHHIELVCRAFRVTADCACMNADGLCQSRDMTLGWGGARHTSCLAVPLFHVYYVGLRHVVFLVPWKSTSTQYDLCARFDRTDQCSLFLLDNRDGVIARIQQVRNSRLVESTAISPQSSWPQTQRPRQETRSRERVAVTRACSTSTTCVWRLSTPEVYIIDTV